MEDRLLEHRSATSKLQTIQNGYHQLFQQLWEEIVKIAKEATVHGMQIGTGGDQLKRTVQMHMNRGRGIMATYEEPPPSRVLTVAVSEDRRKITSKSDAGIFEFDVDLCEDGVICLKMQGVEISPKDAARRIMEPFLFEGRSPFSSEV